jgi:hypothetical protein
LDADPTNKLGDATLRRYSRVKKGNVSPQRAKAKGVIRERSPPDS